MRSIIISFLLGAADGAVLILAGLGVAVLVASMTGVLQCQ